MKTKSEQYLAACVAWAKSMDPAIYDPDHPRPTRDPENAPNGDYDEHWVDLYDDPSFWKNGPEYLLAAAFDPRLHPRGRDGKFIEVGGWVKGMLRLESGVSKMLKGQVTSINEDGSFQVQTNEGMAIGWGRSVRETAKPKAHGVGVSANFGVKRREGESDESFHHRIFMQGQEDYEPVEALADAAWQYREEHGLPHPVVHDWRSIEAPLDRLRAVAELFESLTSNPDDPEAQAAYAELVRQTKMQYAYLTEVLGVRVEYLTPQEIRQRGLDPSGLNPYPSAAAQAEDIRNNKHLMIASLGADEYQAYRHPILDSSIGGEYDMFRAVHDAFGHGGIASDFSRHGEFQAYLYHMSMFWGGAARAASMELTGENSYLVSGRGPAPHKAALMPDIAVTSPWREDGSLDLAAVTPRNRREDNLVAAGMEPYVVVDRSPEGLDWGVVNPQSALLGLAMQLQEDDDEDTEEESDEDVDSIAP